MSSGGSAGHIATLEFLRKTKLPIDTIPPKGTAPANADLLSGSVQLFMDPWTALLPCHLGQGAGLFVTSKERTKLACPTFRRRPAGSTLRDFNIGSWKKMQQAPRDTSDAVVDKLAAAMAEASKDPAFVATTTGLVIVPTARGPKDFTAFIKSEVETNTALLKEAGYGKLEKAHRLGKVSPLNATLAPVETTGVPTSLSRHGRRCRHRTRHGCCRRGR